MKFIDKIHKKLALLNFVKKKNGIISILKDASDTSEVIGLKRLLIHANF